MRDPPARYRTTVGEIALLMLPPSELAAACSASQADPLIEGGHIAACSIGPTVIMPDPASVDSLLWMRMFFHELAHVLGGWPADHPGSAPAAR